MVNICTGGECAAVCPIYNPGGSCSTPVAMYNRWRTETHAFVAAVTGAIAVITSVVPPETFVN